MFINSCFRFIFSVNVFYVCHDTHVLKGNKFGRCLQLSIMEELSKPWLLINSSQDYGGSAIKIVAFVFQNNPPMLLYYTILY